MTAYEITRRTPAAFYRLFGCSVEEFDRLYTEFAVVHTRRLTETTLTRRGTTPRKRKPGAGRRFRNTLRERLLLALFWLRVHPTLELLGYFFELGKTSAEDNLKDVLATLDTMACFTLEHPEMHRPKQRTLQQLLHAFPDAALIIGTRNEGIKPRNAKNRSRRMDR